VACLASYNDGVLYGEWIDANQSPDALLDSVKNMLAGSSMEGAEEWAIHDSEGFGDVHLSESESFDEISRMAEFIEKQGELGIGLLCHTLNDVEDAERLLDECYCGEYKNAADFAENITEDTITVPENLAFYIDYDLMARDLFINDYFFIEVGNNIHVFRYD